MTFKLQAQAGSRRRSCGVTPRTISGMPSSTERDEWGACTFFGRVLKAADITSVRLGSAQCGIAQPCLTLSGQRSKRGAPYGVSCGRERDMAYWSCRPQIIRHPTTLATMVTRASEKVRPHRPRQNKGAASPTKAHGAFRKIGEAVNRQGTLTITGWQCASGR
jgi:hypothetical protein